MNSIRPSGISNSLILSFIFMVASFTTTIPSAYAGSVASVSIDQSPPITVDADSQIQFSATLYDSTNSVTSGIIEWSSTNGTIDGAGLFTPWAAENVTITAVSEGVSDFINITVEAGWPSSLSVYSNVTEVGLDTTAQLIADLVDARGNTVPGQTLTWSPSQGSVDENGIWTPAEIGNASIEVHWGELSATVVISVIPGQATIISLPSDLSVRSGESITIEPTAQDSFGNTLDMETVGTLQWNAESGIISNGVYTGGDVGIWNVSCSTSNGLSATTQVEVISAAIESVELSVEERTFRADEAIEVIVLRTDVYGNVVEEIVPLVNWTYESGSLRNGVNATEWLPSSVGNWTLSVSVEGLVASTSIEVVHGYASELLLVTEMQRVSADDDVVIHMQARDIRNNRWVVTGTWETEDSVADSWLTSFGTWANFEATTAGEWKVKGTWFDEEQQEVFESELTIDVFPGELSLIELQGNGEIISTDEVLDLSPVMYDSDGNNVGTVLLNWSVDGEDRTTEFRLYRGVYYPQEIGLHEIRAQADGAYSSVMVQVNPGRARDISLNISSNISLSSGLEGEKSFTVFGTDLSGNSFLVDNLSWIIPEGAGEIKSGTNSGEWIITGHTVGDWTIELISEDAQAFVELEVTAGQASRIEVILSGDQFHQGEEITIDVRIFDSFNNTVAVAPADIQVSSTAGPASHQNQGSWKIVADTGGSDHAVTIRHNDITVQKYFDVQGALLGGALGSSDSVVLFGTLIIAIILGTMVIIMRNTREEESSEGEPQEELKEIQKEIVEKKQSVAAVSEEPRVQDETQALSQTPEQIASEAAAKAKSTGVMVAAEGTVQGQSGWYYDATGELTNWEVDSEGRWNRLH